ncbi:hypothetical protein SeLEV6574_g00300 [Synchytrium endobioticum]|uniref:Uncharacterized protein n=1 Tax=Synchytrium endobioticum TaxID=286115 RepID=A0A507DJM1_9FUNG|nr:hypothetical protein SeLEV6574_g00300 [Synchytrium endobioticum]
MIARMRKSLENTSLEEQNLEGLARPVTAPPNIDLLEVSYINTEVKGPTISQLTSRNGNLEDVGLHVDSFTNTGDAQLIERATAELDPQCPNLPLPLVHIRPTEIQEPYHQPMSSPC